jgi:hypothetical protein
LLLILDFPKTLSGRRGILGNKLVKSLALRERDLG